MHLEKKDDLKPSGNNADDVWYTLYFDPESVTFYASAGGYDETKASLVANYKHGIKNITENGPVYLKLAPGLYMLDEISLTSPRKVKRSDSDMYAYKQIWNPPTK